LVLLAPGPSADLIDLVPVHASTSSFDRETEASLDQWVSRWLTLMVSNFAAGWFVDSMLTAVIYFWVKSLGLNQGSV